MSSATLAMAESNALETRAEIENRQLRATSPSMNPRTAPAESARTRIGCTTLSASSPGW
ncbi:MAG: hypothetical protein IPL07_18900 [Acidimicrobiaceae bacterium]|nr:hypothetical protein [Acidimicrobiaceae bacterium]